MTIEGTVGEPSLKASGPNPVVLHGAAKTDSAIESCLSAATIQHAALLPSPF